MQQEVVVVAAGSIRLQRPALIPDAGAIRQIAPLGVKPLGGAVPGMEPYAQGHRAAPFPGLGLGRVQQAGADPPPPVGGIDPQVRNQRQAACSEGRFLGLRQEGDIPRKAAVPFGDKDEAPPRCCSA